MRLSANQPYLQKLRNHHMRPIPCINHAYMQHIGHVDVWAAEMVPARGSCASRQITNISGTSHVCAFIETFFPSLGQAHKPSKI